MPPRSLLLFGLMFMASSYIVGRDKDYFGVLMLGLLALVCFFMILTSNEFSAGPQAFRTWISLGPIRYSIRDISAEGLMEVLAYSFYSTISGMWFHRLRLRWNRDSQKNVLDLWSGTDVTTSAAALVQWLNEHRTPNSEPIGFKKEKVSAKDRQRIKHRQR